MPRLRRSSTSRDVAHPRALLSDRTSAPASKVRPLLALDHGLIDEEDRLPAGRA